MHSKVLKKIIGSGVVQKYYTLRMRSTWITKSSRPASRFHGEPQGRRSVFVSGGLELNFQSASCGAKGFFLQLRRSVGPPPENIWNFDALRRNFRPFMACIIWNIQGALLSYASYAHVYFEIDKARWTFRSVVHKKIWRLLKKVGAIAPQPQWCAAHGQPTCITTLEFLRIARIRFHYLCLNPFKNESVSARNRSL